MILNKNKIKLREIFFQGQVKKLQATFNFKNKILTLTQNILKTTNLNYKAVKIIIKMKKSKKKTKTKKICFKSETNKNKDLFQAITQSLINLFNL